jgi:hypothetical protein
MGTLFLQVVGASVVTADVRDLVELGADKLRLFKIEG